MISLNLFKKFTNVYHGFSERSDGNMSFKWGEKEDVVRNRESLSLKASFNLNRVVQFDLAHSTKVRVAKEDDVSQLMDANKALENTDSAISNLTDTTLFLLTGDCLPIIFYDSKNKVVAIAHAGWRGVVGKIFLKTLLTMCSTYGSKQQNIYIGIGPAIGKCCQVTRDPNYFKEYPEWKNYYSLDSDGAGHLDLIGFTINELIEAGVSERNIENANLCTNDNKDRFFTHKINSPDYPEGRFASFVGLS